MKKAIVLSPEELVSLFETEFPCGCKVSDSDLDSKPYIISGVSKDEAVQFIRRYGSKKHDVFDSDGLYLSDATMSAFLTKNLSLPEGIGIAMTDFIHNAFVAVLSCVAEDSEAGVKNGLF